MSNMSYCRFQNTLSDFLDCRGYLYDPLSGNEDEADARAALVSNCARVLMDLGFTVEDEHGTSLDDYTAPQRHVVVRAALDFNLDRTEEGES